MRQPKISIVTPSYNQGAYIEETIVSIFQGGYPNLELVIIDGGSTDGTLDIIKKYEDRIAYWISEPDSGQSEAMNKGLKKITGDIVTFISSDDLIIPGAFYKIAHIFSSLPESVGLIHGGTLVFDDRGNQKVNYGYDYPTIERYLGGIAFSFAATYMRRKYIELVGPYDEHLHMGMDYDLIARLALIGDFRRVNHIFTKYRFHPGSKSFKSEKLFVEDWIRVFIRLAYNLDEQWVLSELKKLDFLDKYPNYAQRYSFQFQKPQLDPPLMFYYFLSEVFCADYRNGNFDRARRIQNYLRDKFVDLFRKSEELKVMRNRLIRYPPLAFRFIRAIKRYV